MRYNVVSTALADLQLGEIWLEAANPQAATSALDRNELLLRTNPDQLGAQRTDGLRVIALLPLVVTCRVGVDGRMVTILSIKWAP